MRRVCVRQTDGRTRAYGRYGGGAGPSEFVRVVCCLVRGTRVGDFIIVVGVCDRVVRCLVLELAIYTDCKNVIHFTRVMIKVLKG